MKSVKLGPSITVEDLVRVARHNAEVSPLDANQRARMEASRKVVVDALQEPNSRVYGVTTGYGSLVGTSVSPDEAAALSRNVLLKCAVGVGDPLPSDWVRGMILVRANSLAIGASGVRPRVVETLIEMLNRGVTPVVPSKGSLGASGDLAPLAHIAIVATAARASDDTFSGEAWFDGRLMSGADAMAEAGIQRPILEAKEGLGLTNGTAMMAAGAALLVHDTINLLTEAQLAAALSFEALKARSSALDPDLHRVNRQKGPEQCAEKLRSLLASSQLIDGDPEQLQDAYSIRCTPQIVGPVIDMMSYLKYNITTSLNAVSDNPLVFPEDDAGPGRVVSGGNFHGAGLALWLDTLGIAIADVASVSERRIFRMLTPELSGGLPAMLTPSPGIHGGLMSVQYTAAALVSENKTLAHPDSVDTVPTSANQEDHVSMGANAALHAHQIVENVRMVLAAELLTAAQAVDLRKDGPSRLGRGTRAVYDAIRERVDFAPVDRAFAPDLARIEEALTLGTLRKAVSQATEAN